MSPAAPYRVEFRPAARRQFKKLPEDVKHRIAGVIERLSADARPHGVVKIAGAENLFRVRSGDYRIFYSIQDDRLLLLIVKIGHRREIYRKL